MKRTRETAEALLPKPYIDPVSHEAAIEPIILLGCGHTFDRSTVEKLGKMVADVSGKMSYTCPLCAHVSLSIRRNYAMDEMIGMTNHTPLALETSVKESIRLDQLNSTLVNLHKRFDAEILAALIDETAEREKHILACDSYVHGRLLEYIKTNHRETYYRPIKGNPERKALRIKADSIPCFDTFTKFMIWFTIPFKFELYSTRLANIGIELSVTLTNLQFFTIATEDYTKWAKKWNEVYINIGYLTQEEIAIMAQMAQQNRLLDQLENDSDSSD